MHACMHAGMHACTRTHIQTCADIHTCMHACMHAYVLACLQLYIDTLIYTNIKIQRRIAIYAQLSTYKDECFGRSSDPACEEFRPSATLLSGLGNHLQESLLAKKGEGCCWESESLSWLLRNLLEVTVIGMYCK